MANKIYLCLLLIILGTITVHGKHLGKKNVMPAAVKRQYKFGTCDWPMGACYYIHDRCPAGTVECNDFPCTSNTNKCCCN
ncbi:small cysteine-rich protein 2-like [Oculina patagonica]